MVRLNKQRDFQFPFLASDSSSSIQISISNHLDLADKVLSIFAVTFFLTILFAITLDNANPESYISANYITKLEPQVENIIPLFDLEKSKTPIKNNEKPQISKKKILALAPLKKETNPRSKVAQKVTVPILNTIWQNASKVVSNFPKQKISNSTEYTSLEKIHFNQPKIKETISDVKITTTAKTIKFSPKPVFVDRKIDINELVINKKITQDLLPLSYFLAKEKAAHDGKLMYIKFGAKWCLPCRQMETTTFKDKRVLDFSEKNYVVLSVDVDDFDGVNMKAYFNIKFLPTLLIFNSQGNFIAKYVNYQSASSMLGILEKHKYEDQVIPTIASNEVIPSQVLETSKVKEIASINFNKIILSKKRNGKAINSLKSKAKNWRFTNLDFSTKNIYKGKLLLKVIETTTGFNVIELNIPMIKNPGIADTTTTNFQLVLEHEKRKKKNGEYVVEIYHVNQNESMLVGKTTLLKDGEIHF